MRVDRVAIYLLPSNAAPTTCNWTELVFFCNLGPGTRLYFPLVVATLASWPWHQTSQSDLHILFCSLPAYAGTHARQKLLRAALSAGSLSLSLSGAQSQAATVPKRRPSWGVYCPVCKSLFWTQLCKTRAQMIGWNSRKKMEKDRPHGLQYVSFFSGVVGSPTHPAQWTGQQHLASHILLIDGFGTFHFWVPASRSTAGTNIETMRSGCATLQTVNMFLLLSLSLSSLLWRALLWQGWKRVKMRQTITIRYNIDQHSRKHVGKPFLANMQIIAT